MNNEIKETLERLEELRNSNYTFSTFDIGLVLDYITNLQTIEREYSAILSENAELQQGNERLKELCDKYEEEHNTTFKKWQQDIQANKKAIKYIRIQQTIFKDYDVVIENQLKNILNILEENNE